MTRLESLIEQLKNGSETDKTNTLFALITSDPKTDFKGYSGYNRLTPKGGNMQYHSTDFETVVYIWRLNTRSYKGWNAHIIEGFNSNEPKVTDIIVKFDRQDTSFLKGFVAFCSMGVIDND